MGKNKGHGKKKQLNSIFKVAGAKSLKLKANKAKPVKGALKNLKKVNSKKGNNKVKEQEVREVDQQLVNLQDKVRNTTPSKGETSGKNKKGKGRKPLPKAPAKVSQNDVLKSQQSIEEMQL